MTEVIDTREKLETRFLNLRKIYRALMDATPSDPRKKKLQDDFMARAPRFRLHIKNIKSELTQDVKDDYRLRALIFNFEEQIIDYLTVIMDDEQIADFIKTKSIPEGF